MFFHRPKVLPAGTFAYARREGESLVRARKGCRYVEKEPPSEDQIRYVPQIEGADAAQTLLQVPFAALNAAFGPWYSIDALSPFERWSRRRTPSRGRRLFRDLES